jgi:hypothetical protein
MLARTDVGPAAESAWADPDLVVPGLARGTAHQEIEADLRAIGQGLVLLVGESLVSVLAVGSIGRAHVTRRSLGATSIEDYDLIVVVDLSSDLARSQLRRRISRWLHETCRQSRPPVSVGIRLRRELPRLPFTLFHYEMRHAYRIIAGTDPTPEMPLLRAADLPLIEATRLLLNRGVLLWGDCVQAAHGGLAVANADRLALTVRKVVLALGDAVLIANRAYHWSYAERLTSVERCSGFDRFAERALGPLYKHALEAKVEGKRTEAAPTELLESLPSLLGLHEVVFRDVEQRRLGRSVKDWSRYADGDVAYPGDLTPSRLKRLSRAWRVFGMPRSIGFARAQATRTAEEILLRAFPALAYVGPTALGSLSPRLNVLSAGADARAVWQQFHRAWARCQ